MPTLALGLRCTPTVLRGPLRVRAFGRGALATHGQAAQMANAPITLDALKPFQIQAQFAAKIPFNDILAVLDGMDDLAELLLIQILGANTRLDFGLDQNVNGVRRPMP